MNTTFAENGLSSHLSAFDVGLLAAILVNFVLSLPLNGYVLWLILTGARETLASNFFALNLAISEVMMCLFTLFYILYRFGFFFFCFEVFMSSRGLLYTARPLFQCCICVECYVAVVHPVLFLRFKPLRYKVACCCVVWSITLLSCIFSWYTFTKPMYLYGYFIQNLLYVSVMFFCCLSVLWALKRPGPGEKDKQTKKTNTIKRTAFKTILLVMIAMANYFVLFTVAIPLQSCLTCIDYHITLIICGSLALLTGFMQPLLYLHRAGKLPWFKKV